VADGPVREVLAAYRGAVEERAEQGASPIGPIRVLKAVAAGAHGPPATSQAPFEVTLVLESDTPRSTSLCIGVSDGPASPFFLVRRDLFLTSGETEARLTIPNLPLPRGRFYLWGSILDADGRDLLTRHTAHHFDVSGASPPPPPPGVV